MSYSIFDHAQLGHTPGQGKQPDKAPAHVSDVLTIEDVRQCFCEDVPGFAIAAADSLGLSMSEFYKRLQAGKITKSNLLRSMALMLTARKDIKR